MQDGVVRRMILSVRSERKAKRINIIKNITVFMVTFMLIMIFFYFIRFPNVDGESMNPTYDDKDILVTLHTNNVSRNDVIVLWSDFLQEYIVKRVVGVAGDHIEIKDEQLYRNGYPIYEGYVLEQSWAGLNNSLDIIIPEDCVFVLGDNRNNSADSRVLGCINTDDIFGKVLFKLGK